MNNIFKEISVQITNRIDESELDNPYSVMIGKNPSNGAKSPALWNYLLQGRSKMICLDIPNKISLEKVFKILKKDANCLGGAVTAPYKELAYLQCSKKSYTSEKSKACNNFYRDQEHSDEFIADNTDGIGFIKAINHGKNIKEFESIILLGHGGVGKSISAALVEFDIKSNLIVLTTQKPNIGLGYTCMSYNDFEESLKDTIYGKTLLINCTSVGDYTNPKADIFAEISCLDRIIASIDVSYFFDCIHTPEITSLGKLFKDKCQNGKDMNRYQAAVSFCNVYNTENIDEISQKLKSRGSN